MSGNDIKEGLYLRQAFSLLNSNEIDIPDQDCKDNDTPGRWKRYRLRSVNSQ